MLTGLEEDEYSMDNFETKSFERLFAGDSNAANYSDLGTMVNPRLLKSIFVSEDWIFILVDRIAQKLAQIPWQVHSRNVVNGEEVLKPALNHPVQKMLDNPNPLQDQYSFKYGCIVDYSVTGNAIIYMARQSNWLVQVPTEIIQPDITGRGELKGYDVIGMDPMSFPVSSRTKLRPEDVIHVKRPNPSSVYWGLSPLVPGANPALFNRYTNEYLLNFYRKGAQPGMILEMGEESNEVQAKKLLLTLETTYTGRTNQRRGMVLPKGVKATSFAHTLADQQLITYIQNNRETLINIYGVPKHELSLAESGSIGSEEYKTALKNFWEGPLMAIGSMFASAMTMRLSAQLGPMYVIRLNYSNVPILQEDLDDKALTANSMLGTMTYNEVRQKIWKLPPIPGGDVLRDMRPMFPSFPEASLSVTPPAPESSVQVGEPVEGMKPDYRQQNIQAFSEYVKADGNGWFAENQARQGEAANKNMTEVQKLFLKMLGDQIYAVARIVKEEVIEKAAEVPDERQLKARIDAAMKKLKTTWVKNYGKTLEGQVEIGYDTTINVPFNKPYEEAIAAVSNKQRRREMLDARAIDTFENLTKTTTDKIMAAVSKGIKEGKTVAEIAEGIRNIAAVSAGRANTIARTETLTANSIGQAAAMEDAASVIPKLVKVWINAGDDRVRGNPGGLYPNSEADHWEMQGEVQDYNKDFSNGLSYPRDTKGSPGETINCFPAGTIIEGSGIEASFQRFYCGPIVTIDFKSGNKITATPNHPILSPKGWVSIGSLTKGDQVFKASSLNRLASPNGNIDHIKTSIDKVLNSFPDSSVGMRKAGSIMDFHGDGSTEHVDIKSIDRVLKNGTNAMLMQKPSSFTFPYSRLTHGFSLRSGTFNKPLSRVRSSHASVGCSDLKKPLLSSHLRPFKKFSLASGTVSITVMKEKSCQMNSGISSLPTDFSHRELLNEVHIDEVIDIKVDEKFRGHVYNLQTVPGWYLAENYITHNCRCTWLTLAEEDAAQMGFRR